MKRTGSVKNYVISEVTYDFSEILSHPANRVGSFDEEVAEEYGWTKNGLNDFRRRVNNIKTSIKKHGVLPFSCLIVGVFDGKHYLIDGQSRKAAIEELNEEKKANGDDNLYCIEVRYYAYSNEKEMIKHMEISNSYHRNWTIHQKTNAHIEAEFDGQEKLELRETQRKIEEYADIAGMGKSTVLCVMFGQHASKSEQIGKYNMFTDRYWKYTPKFINDIIRLNKTVIANSSLNGKQKKVCSGACFVNGFRSLHNRIEKSNYSEEEKKQMHIDMTNRLDNYISLTDEFNLNRQLRFATNMQAETVLKGIILKGIRRNNRLYELLS